MAEQLLVDLLGCQPDIHECREGFDDFPVSVPRHDNLRDGGIFADGSEMRKVGSPVIDAFLSNVPTSTKLIRYSEPIWNLNHIIILYDAFFEIKLHLEVLKRSHLHSYRVFSGKETETSTGELFVGGRNLCAGKINIKILIYIKSIKTKVKRVIQ